MIEQKARQHRAGSHSDTGRRREDADRGSSGAAGKGSAPNPRAGSVRVSSAVLSTVLSGQVSTEHGMRTPRINLCRDFGNVKLVVMNA